MWRPEGRKNSEPKRSRPGRWWQRRRGGVLCHRYRTSSDHLRKFATTFSYFYLFFFFASILIGVVLWGFGIYVHGMRWCGMANEMSVHSVLAIQLLLHFRTQFPSSFPPLPPNRKPPCISYTLITHPHQFISIFIY